MAKRLNVRSFRLNYSEQIEAVLIRNLAPNGIPSGIISAQRDCLCSWWLEVLSSSMAPDQNFRF